MNELFTLAPNHLSARERTAFYSRQVVRACERGEALARAGKTMPHPVFSKVNDRQLALPVMSQSAA